MNGDQPQELRDYLIEAEAVTKEWYSRAGIEPSHEVNLDLMATLLCLNVIMEPEWPFTAVRDAARLGPASITSR